MAQELKPNGKMYVLVQQTYSALHCMTQKVHNIFTLLT